nr:lipopolysaccharide biosynthesis protein [Salicibibacter cibi]
MIFTQLGVGPALIQRMYLEERHIRTGFTASILLGFTFTLLIIIFAPVIASLFLIDELTEVLRVISVMFIFQSVGIVAESLLRRELRFRNIAIMQVVSFSIGYGLMGITLGLLDFGVWALVGAHISQTLLKMSLMLYFRPHSKKLELNVITLKELLLFGGGHTLGKIGNFFALQGDNAVVGRFLGAEALGFYGRAYQLMMMPVTLFGTVLDKILFPAMSTIQEQNKRILRVYRRGIAMVSLIIIPIGAFLWLAAPEIVLMLLGTSWTEIIPAFQILIAGLLFRTSYRLSDSLIRAKGAVYRNSWRQWVYALAVLIGSYIGHFWGVSGVAFGVLLALTLNYFLLAKLSLKLIGMRWKEYLGAHIPGLLLGTLVFGEVWVLLKLFRAYELTPLVSVGAIGILVLLSVWIVYRYGSNIFFGKDGVWAINTVKQFIYKRLKRNI